MEAYTKSTPKGRTFITVRSQKTSDQSFAPDSNITDVIRQSWTDGFSGFRDPNWRDNVRNHRNATTPYDGTVRTWRARRGEFHSRETRDPPYYPFSFEIKSRVCDIEGVTGGMPITGTPPTEDAAVANAAVIGFLKKIRKTQRHFQGGVFLGEAREALHMLRNPAKSLRKRVGVYIDGLKKVPRKRLRNPRYIADSYLEATFGWTPFISDIVSASEVLRKLGEHNFEDYSKVSFRAQADTHVSHNYDINNWSNIRLHVETVRTVRNRTYVRYTGAVKVRSAGTPEVDRKLLGFSWNEFVPTAWELLPWSFLMDYFSNIGDVIEAWTTCTSDLAWCNRTSVRTRISRSSSYINETLTRNSYWQGNGCRGYAYGNGGWVEVRDKRFVRSIGITDAPRISFEIPGFGRRWVNMAALVSARRDLRNLIT